MSSVNDSIKMKKEISILGCGWLGMPLATKLINDEFVIKGSTTSLSKIERLKLEGIIPYIVNLKNIENNISDFLSSEILVISIPSKNIDDFKNLIQQIEVSRVKKILFISSTSVYANSKELVTEETIVKVIPLSIIEKLFRENASFKSTIIRFGGLFGYNRKPGNFISESNEIENPEGYVNLIHRDDCIQIIEQIIKKNIWNETFNACTDSHPTRREFYLKETKKVGQKAPTFNENSLNEYKIVSNTKLKTMLNFRFKYPNLLNYED